MHMGMGGMGMRPPQGGPGMGGMGPRGGMPPQGQGSLSMGMGGGPGMGGEHSYPIWFCLLLCRLDGNLHPCWAYI